MALRTVQKWPSGWEVVQTGCCGNEEYQAISPKGKIALRSPIPVEVLEYAEDQNDLAKDLENGME